MVEKMEATHGIIRYTLQEDNVQKGREILVLFDLNIKRPEKILKLIFR